MKAVFVVIFVMIGSAFCKSLPLPPSPQTSQADGIEIASLKGNPVALIRRARQYGYFNNYDYNPFNDTPNNYDGTPYNDTPHRQLYNNFDYNSFNNSPNNYDSNPYNDSFYYGKK